MPYYSTTTGADNCGCAVKIKMEMDSDGSFYDIVSIQVVKHCDEH